ncbi:16S rRNA (guanine(527)-N(7))-methyltransferase RsmG [Acidipropionibacterium timonense]|uniref:16S rRNA (guanine(527)-N(7))-methyltransferase RsmG n=1 Tax=Acidipropionibacterium timonense TaxID=2161818 RepID=UPI00102FF876|nr:16S rRNA (guanine(527)-N(7))-methyltransferase RsmG [Acidipropionibacterium timonense]
MDVAEELYGDNFIWVKKYVDILATSGVDWGLIGPQEEPRLWQRHILNSAAIHRLIPEGCEVADVGSGAGLPGIPLALLRPDLEITLVEPLLRRSNFLIETVDALHLGDQVHVIRSRAEELDTTFDVVTARAVAGLIKLINWTGKLFIPHGILLALKGQGAEAEVEGCLPELSRRHLAADVLVARAAPGAEITHVTRVREMLLTEVREY